MRQRVSFIILVLISASSAFPQVDRASKFPRMFVGTVSDADGRPIEGARVEYGFFDARPKEREFTTTDSAGAYRLEVTKAGRDFRMGVSAAGFAPAFANNMIPGPMDKPSEFSVQLYPGSTIQLKVVTKSGQSASGVKVRPRTAPHGYHSSFSHPVPATNFPGLDRTATIDADGLVTLRDLPSLLDYQEPKKDDKSISTPLWQSSQMNWPWIELQVFYSGGSSYGINISSKVAAQAKKDGQPIEITVREHVTRNEKSTPTILKGRVVDKETDESVTGFAVVRRYRTKVWSFASADGRFEIDTNLPPDDRCEVRVFKPGYAVATLKMTANERPNAEEQTIRLEKHSPFKGQVINWAGEPVAGLELVSGFVADDTFKYVEWQNLDEYADGHHPMENVLRVTTDAEGKFSIAESPSRPVTLIIKAEGFGREIVPPEQRPVADERGLVPIQLKKAASVIAIADSTELGKLIHRFSLGFKSNDGFEHMTSSSKMNDQGQHLFTSLAPGEYSVTPYCSAGHSLFPIMTRKMTLAEGQQVRVVFGGEMPGKLKLTGQARPYDQIAIREKNGKSNTKYFGVLCDVDGEFELSGLASGEYTVTSSTSSSSNGSMGSSSTGHRAIVLNEDMHVDLRARPPVAADSKP